MHTNRCLIRSIVATALSACLATMPPALFGSAQTLGTLHHDVHYLVATGGKPIEAKARLVFTDGSLQVQGNRGGGVLQELRYADIRAATYSKSKHPRWKAGVAVALAVNVFALPVFFMKSKKHWLTVQAEGQHAVFRLSKKNYTIVVAVFESHTGVKVGKVLE